jgi:signal transduction histidine kinase
MRRLLDSGRALVADLDPQAVLVRTLAVARELTGARYGGLGILDAQRDQLEQFLTVGMDERTRGEIAAVPWRRGVLGPLIAERTPRRVTDVSRDPGAGALGIGDPQTRSFLGVPILIDGRAWGALYLTEKQGGEFTEADEEAAVILADWAATAIRNANRHRASESRRIGHEQAAGATGVGGEVAIGLGSETDLERVLDLILRRGRALIDGRSAGVGVGPTAGATSAEEDEELLSRFAASASAAVAMAQGVESERLRSLMAAGDAERTRWARELHDETLQGLGAIRLVLAAARRRGDATRTALAVDEAIDYIEQEIDNLHAIISDLRPAALDELGLRPALEALLERRSDHGALRIASVLVLPDPQAGEPRLEPAIESTVYRVVQEALTNIVKHADARSVRVAVTASAGAVSIEVQDDGVGFAPGASGSGFGLAGIRERVQLAGGTVRIESGEGGTRVRAALPAHARSRSGHSAVEGATTR